MEEVLLRDCERSGKCLVEFPLLAEYVIEGLAHHSIGADAILRVQPCGLGQLLDIVGVIVRKPDYTFALLLPYGLAGLCELPP